MSQASNDNTPPTLEEQMRAMTAVDLYLSIEEFTGDKTTERMETGLKVLKGRFPEANLQHQLTWFLGAAATRGGIAAMDYLLKQGALIDGMANVPLPGYATINAYPLDNAISNGRPEALKFLLEKGAKKEPNRALLPRATSSTPETMRVLLQAGVRDHVHRALAKSLLEDRLDIAEVITSEGAAHVNDRNGYVVSQIMFSVAGAVRHPDAERRLRFIADHGGDFWAVARRLDEKGSDKADAAAQVAEHMQDYVSRLAFNLAAKKLAQGAGKVIDAPEKAVFAKKARTPGVA